MYESFDFSFVVVIVNLLFVFMMTEIRKSKLKWRDQEKIGLQRVDDHAIVIARSSMKTANVYQSLDTESSLSWGACMVLMLQLMFLYWQKS